MESYIEKTLKLDGLQIRFLSKELQTEERKIWACKQNGWALSFIEDQSPKVIAVALKENATAEQFIHNVKLKEKFSTAQKVNNQKRIPSGARQIYVL